MRCASVGTLPMLQFLSPSSPQTSPWHCPRNIVVDHDCAEEIDNFLVQRAKELDTPDRDKRSWHCAR